MLVLLSLGLSLLDSLALLKRAAQWYRQTPPGERSWRVLQRELFESKKDTRASLAYEMAARESGDHDAPGGTYREGAYVRGRAGEQVVFAIGEDVDCEEGVDSVARQEEARQQQPQQSRRSHGSTSSHRSSGSEYTLRDSPCSGTPPVGFPFAMEGATGRGSMQKHNRPLEMGAYDLPLGSPADEERIAPDDVRALLPSMSVNHDAGHTGDVKRRKSMTMQRFGELCLTWIRRSQVVLAYVAVLSGIAIYTVSVFLPLAHDDANRHKAHTDNTGHVPRLVPTLLSRTLHQRLHLFRLRCSHLCPVPRRIRRYGLVLESRACRLQGALGRDGRVRSDLHVWDHQYLDGAIWRQCGGRVYGQAGAAYQYCRHVSVSGPIGDLTVMTRDIALNVRFWFAGLTGMLLESKTIRRVLGSAVGRSAEEPASYTFSFNPLPALVIAVVCLYSP